MRCQVAFKRFVHCETAWENVTETFRFSNFRREKRPDFPTKREGKISTCWYTYSWLTHPNEPAITCHSFTTSMKGTCKVFRNHKTSFTNQCHATNRHVSTLYQWPYHSHRAHKYQHTSLNIKLKSPIHLNMGVGTIVCGWDRTHPLLKTNDIGPTHFYVSNSVNMSVHFSEHRKSNPFHMTNALID